MARRTAALDLLRATPDLPPDLRLARAQRRGSKAAAAHRGAVAGARSARRNQGTPHPASSDRIYADDESEFLAAMARFQAESGKRFPSWSDALEVLKRLGYRKP